MPRGGGLEESSGDPEAKGDSSLASPPVPVGTLLRAVGCPLSHAARTNAHAREAVAARGGFESATIYCKSLLR
jgi:hypothetical protein